MKSKYIGRFAPSPTGPLHFGSLVAATASFLDARAHGGNWLLRIEDADTPRVQPGSAVDILATLEEFGFVWDGPVLHQSTRIDAYREALQQLQRQADAYPCTCSRKEVGGRYPGTCRTAPSRNRLTCAWRVRVEDSDIVFEDRWQGPQRFNLEQESGDFVVLRADGLFAYQLAVVVDDRDQGVTDIVRGADLLDSTPRQIQLQRLLGAPTPRYLHAPVAVNADGQKLSKQTRAPSIRHLDPASQIRKALAFLRQPTPAEGLSLAELWTWAISHWTATLGKETANQSERPAGTIGFVT